MVLNPLFRRCLKRMKNIKLLILAITIAYIAMGILFIHNIWRDCKQKEESHAMELARAAEAFVSADLLRSLDVALNDIDKPGYKQLKDSLISFKERSEGVRFAYLYTLIDGKICFMVDSEAPGTDGYSPPGQFYPEATPETVQPFIEGKTIIAGPVTDRWGTWISVLVPVMDGQTGEVIAVFGVDYPTENWNAEISRHVVHAIVVVSCILLLLIALYLFLVKNMAVKSLGGKLEESEALFRAVFEQAPVGIAVIKDLDCLVRVNKMFEKILDRPQKELDTLKLLSITHPEDKKENLENYEKFKSGVIDGYSMEKRYMRPDGSYIWVHLAISSLQQNGKRDQDHGNQQNYLCIIQDINELKQSLLRVQYMNEHDYLTGLYNRKYFEEAKKRLDQEGFLPLGIIIGDINGTRLINYAFGLAEGDRMITETARIIRSCCREGDIPARTGGDEFSMLLPNTDRDEADEIIQRITNACEQYNLTLGERAPRINLSIGYGIKQTRDESIQAVNKEAEEYMYKRKLLEGRSYHSAILSSIMAALYARSQETEEHAERLAALSKMVAEKMNLPQISMDELELFAMLHDIGKVGIDDRILKKTDKLSDAEWEIIKKHPEIGCRIAMASTELRSVARYILTHHERWDGKGYPQGLQGEEIPLLSRILAVVDAYDAMTEDRAYRKALTREQAIEEIRKSAGTQFDPQIVQIFIENI